MEVWKKRPGDAAESANSPITLEEVEKADKVFSLPALKIPDIKGDGGKRDWSAALDLINETYEAIRMAEERVAAIETYNKQLTHHFEEQIKATQTRLYAAEKRADEAEARAKEAEDWLVRFHDSIVEGFQKTLASK